MGEEAKKQDYQSFHYYVATGRAAHPKTRWTKGRGIFDASVEPTRARYDKIFTSE